MRELGEAKQLLIQQKLEVQGRVEEVQAALEQEKTRHQATRDSVTQREEKSRVETQEVQAQLVRLVVYLPTNVPEGINTY